MNDADTTQTLKENKSDETDYWMEREDSDFSDWLDKEATLDLIQSADSYNNY